MLVQRWLERAPLLRRITNLQLNVMQAAYDAGVRNIQVTGDSNLVVKQVCTEIIKICGPPCNKWISFGIDLKRHNVALFYVHLALR